MDELREYTAEEAQEIFLRHVWNLIDYWDREKKDKREAMEGVVFSILATLDGALMELPGCMIVPLPHEDDKNFDISDGQKWFRLYVEGDTHLCDIGAGCLHELFYNFKPGKEGGE